MRVEEKLAIMLEHQFDIQKAIEGIDIRISLHLAQPPSACSWLSDEYAMLPQLT
jgi:hypothetical protein